MHPASLLSPDDQRVTFVELFFDLVFVFAVTQVTHAAAHHLDATGILQSLLVFWLIWWGWSQYTWALNAANTDHALVRVSTLVATGVAFVMAVAADDAFAATSHGAAFAVSYVVVRAFGLVLYYRVVASNAAQQAAVRSFAVLSVTGLVAVAAGGFVDPGVRAWFWLAAVALDFVAVGMAGRSGDWDLHGGHFAERHGLIVIIALGESLIVAASALTDTASREALVIGGLGVALTCLLWWTYFGWVSPLVEHRLKAARGREQATLGRDVFTLGHFPLVSGIVALAVGFVAAFDPAHYTAGQIAAAVGSGLALFLGATAFGVWRATGHVLWTRLAVIAGTLAGLAWAAGWSGPAILGVACAGLGLLVAIEQLTDKRRVERPAPSA